MKLILLVLLFLMIIPLASASTKVLDYGFEDWNTNISNTPGYIFTSSYLSFCSNLVSATEVITSYSGWTPHSGTYFVLEDPSPWEFETEAAIK